MTIGELEQLLDMPRANIRYYEQEGLIAPLRQANGYRDYSEEDARTLEKVRLLRALGCSVAEIRDIKTGKAQLSVILQQKSRAFSRAQEEAADAREVCEAICKSGQRFADLDAKRYLSGAWREQTPVKPIKAPKEALPQISPWRRFWARVLDWQIYAGLWSALISFIYPAAHLSDSAIWTLLEIMMADLIMIALEPLLLRLWGTTPGKWALGLRVHADGGGRLTIRQARARTIGVLWHGLYLNVPVCELRAMWKRYQETKAGAPLSWEDESYIVQRGRFGRRVPGYIALRVAIMLALVCCMGIGRMPMHRGELTPEQFADNYNRLIWAYGAQSREIDADGNWLQRPEEEGMVIIRIGGAEELPGLEMDVRDGIVQGVQLRTRAEAGAEGNMIFIPREQMSFAAMALCGAESPWYREMWTFGSDAFGILDFCENVDATGRFALAEEMDGIDLLAEFNAQSGSDVYRDSRNIGGWVLEYAADCSGGVYVTTDGSAVILPEGEEGEFEMVFTVCRK